LWIELNEVRVETFAAHNDVGSVISMMYGLAIERMSPAADRNAAAFLACGQGKHFKDVAGAVRKADERCSAITAAEAANLAYALFHVALR
jgi:hypothetical protein